METPNQIQLTEKDKVRYRKEFEQVDLEIEQEVMKRVPDNWSSDGLIAPR
ncbi:MAG: hypothetical protein CM1200mP10_19900 [Candidatus Neomarinimicrobiota bacterium]|nr:MAG: hypothetical protein CM1200mP10_19900 [Candidatus Neomarinimicrobiota bacterium]